MERRHPCETEYAALLVESSYVSPKTTDTLEGRRRGRGNQGRRGAIQGLPATQFRMQAVDQWYHSTCTATSTPSGEQRADRPDEERHDARSNRALASLLGGAEYRRSVC